MVVHPRLFVGCPPTAMQVAELNAKVQELEAQFNNAVEVKEAAIKESERCQLKLQLANRLINALASEGTQWCGCYLTTPPCTTQPFAPEKILPGSGYC